MGRQAENIVGNRFGLLVVLAREDTHGKNVRWLCQCDCGKRHSIYGQNLRDNSVKSCGCLAHPPTHGMTNSRLYKTWASMHARCRSPSFHAHAHYADKGISVCAGWIKFEPFRDWAKCSGYEDTLTLDRIDNNKGYQPDNCRFVTIAEQQRNKTNHRYLTFQGKTKRICEFADDLGMSRQTLCNRLSRGWDVARALTTPTRKQA